MRLKCNLAAIGLFISILGYQDLGLSVTISPDLVPISQSTLNYYNEVDEASLYLAPAAEKTDLVVQDQSKEAKKLRSTYNKLGFLIRIFSTPLLGLKVTGKENLPQSEGALVVFNHPSTTEALPFASILGQPPIFMVDKEWFDKPKLNKLFTTFEAISVDRTNGRTGRDSIRAVLDAFKSNKMVVIAPDKGITKEGLMGLKRKHHPADREVELDEFGFKEIDYSTYSLAKKNQTPVILTSIVFQKRWFHGLVEKISFIPNILGFKLSIHIHAPIAPPLPKATTEEMAEYATKCRDTVNMQCLRMVGALED